MVEDKINTQDVPQNETNWAKEELINSDLTISLLHSNTECDIFNETYTLDVRPSFLNTSKNKSQNITSHSRWFHNKIKINHMANEFTEINKRKIVLVDFWMNIWSEINWIRPAIIYTASSFKSGWSTVVIPITSLVDDEWKVKKRTVLDIPLPEDQDNWIDHDSLILVSQIKSIDKKRIRKWKKTNNIQILWTISNDSIKESIDNNCKIMLGL